MSGTIRVVMCCGVVTCSLLRVLMVVARGVRLVMRVRMLGQLHFSLNAEIPQWAKHACGKSAPNREQRGKQQQEPDAEGLHSGQVNTGGKVLSV